MRSKNQYSYSFDHSDIALDEATELPEEFYTLMEKWKKQVQELDERDKISWYSKGVCIDFKYNEKKYRLIAEDFYSEEIVDKMNVGKLNGGYYHALVESIQGKIEKDLLCMGATNVCCYGYLD